MLQNTNNQVLFTKVTGGNFGDDLNNILWKKILKIQFPLDEIALGIGSYEEPKIPKKIKKIHILGSGATIKESYNWMSKFKIEFHFIRGPLSGIKWNHKAPSYLDAAILLKGSNINLEKTHQYKIGYIPHHVSDQLCNYEKICNYLNIKYISPKKNVLNFIDEVRACDLIVSEALHGAILADICRIPWKAISGPHYITEFKWHDWASSLELEYKPDYIENVITRGIELNIRIENSYKLLLYKLGIGKNRWQYKKIFFDKFDKKKILLEEIYRIINKDDWILSRDIILDRNFNYGMDKIYNINRIYG